MKKTITAIVLLTPTILLAQPPSESDNVEFFGYLIALGLLILVWLILRQVTLWYFKINRFIDNQEEQIKLDQERNGKLDELLTILKDKSNG